jgi:serine phosphatase RsbU (regulator of sigma subunit)
VNRVLAVQRALRAAAPHALLDAVRAALTEHFAIDDVELLMADYGLTVLQPVTELPHTNGPVPLHTTPAGRSFGAQQPVTEDTPTGRRLHVPVTVRGDRLGVLSLGLAADEANDTADEVLKLAEVAEILGHELVVAERDTDVYLQARRKDRLTLAAEMQWQLLPGRSCARREYGIGAQLEPAYAIFGDNFDWSADADRLTLTVTNGMGEGIDAALLTNLAINALRNARRAGVSLVDQASLADQAVYAAYAGRMYVSVLLLEFDLASGAIQLIDAGSPRMLRLRAGSVEPIDLDAQLPLGMFDQTVYAAEQLSVLPGDRLLFVSDGVYTVGSGAGEAYGERALTKALSATRLLPPAEVPRAILDELSNHRGAPPPEDDALVVCLDWHGRDHTGE